LNISPDYVLLKVEALTLQHEDGAYEVACNLRRPRVITSDAVLAKVNRDIDSNTEIDRDIDSNTEIDRDIDIDMNSNRDVNMILESIALRCA
jgi:hypothetical protein